MQPPSINNSVSALRFFFTATLDRPDLARRLTVVRRQGNAKGYLAPDRVDELIDWLRKLQTAMRDGAALAVIRT